MTDSIQENDVVVLLEDIPARRLCRGEIGTVVGIVGPSRNDSGYLQVEFENGVPADFDDTDIHSILKLRSRSKRPSLQEWAGATKIFALVFTDIIDSSAFANQLGDERWIEMLQKHFARARELMAIYDCHEIKIIGDSFMVIFRTACEAPDFALALDNDPGVARIKIRAGIHVGSARIVDNDIFGNMVNYTKRVESVTNPIRLKLSDTAKRQVADEGAQRHSGLRYEKVLEVFKGFGEQPIWTVKAQRKKPPKPPAVAHEGILSELTPDEANVARKILAWCNVHFSRVTWTGASFVPVLDYGGRFSHNPITVYCRGKAVRVGIKFGRMKNRNRLSDEKRAELLRRLNKIPGVNLPQDSIDGYPNIPFSMIANARALAQFLMAIAWTIHEVKAAHQNKHADSLSQVT